MRNQTVAFYILILTTMAAILTVISLAFQLPALFDPFSFETAETVHIDGVTAVVQGTFEQTIQIVGDLAHLFTYSATMLISLSWLDWANSLSVFEVVSDSMFTKKHRQIVMISYCLYIVLVITLAAFKLYLVVNFVTGVMIFIIFGLSFFSWRQFSHKLKQFFSYSEAKVRKAALLIHYSMLATGVATIGAVGISVLLIFVFVPIDNSTAPGTFHLAKWMSDFVLMLRLGKMTADYWYAKKLSQNLLNKRKRTK